MLEGEVFAIDLPGHGGSVVTTDEWDGIWTTIFRQLSHEQWNETTLVLHSFSAALLPEIVACSVKPKEVILLEGILYPDDAVWTSELNLIDEARFSNWLARFRSVATMTLKSQLVNKHSAKDIEGWSTGFISVRGDALRIMAYNLLRRLKSQEISNALGTVSFPLTFIRGKRSRLSEVGRSFITTHSVDVIEIAGSGHFPMIDNPIGLKELITKAA